jgi:hypothetical protein
MPDADPLPASSAGSAPPSTPLRCEISAESMKSVPPCGWERRMFPARQRAWYLSHRPVGQEPTFGSFITVSERWRAGVRPPREKQHGPAPEHQAPVFYRFHENCAKVSDLLELSKPPVLFRMSETVPVEGSRHPAGVQVLWERAPVGRRREQTRLPSRLMLPAAVSGRPLPPEGAFFSGRLRDEASASVRISADPGRDRAAASPRHRALPRAGRLHRSA